MSKALIYYDGSGLFLFYLLNNPNWKFELAGQGVNDAQRAHISSFKTLIFIILYALTTYMKVS